MFARTMGRLCLHLHRRLRGRGTAEGGFTLIELVLASGVIALVMSSLAYMGTVAFKDAAIARNRQVATGLASQALEQVRALPYDTVALGLSTADLAAGTDANVTQAGSVYKYNGETIPNGTSNVSIAPLAPHQTTKVQDGTTYTVSVYVTYVDDVTTSRSFRVTAHVSWVSSLRGSGVQKFVDAQTVVYSPTGAGCSSTATHPFAAPCQPFFYGTSEMSDGGVTIAPTLGTSGIPCLSLSKLEMLLPTQSTHMQLEQVETVNATARTSGVELTRSDGSVSSLGEQVVDAYSDSDPSQPKPVYDTETTGTGASVQTSGTVDLNGCSSTVAATSSGGDTATATATVQATATNLCQSSALTPVSMIDSLPCGNAQTTQGGSMSATMNVGGLGTATLVSIANASNGSAGDTNFDATPQTAGVCSTTTGDGCIHVSHRSAIGSLRIGGLPASLAALAPLGFDYLLKLNTFTRTVTAEAGVGNTNPSVSSTGSILYWNGLGYTTLAVNAGASVSIPLQSITINNALTSTTISVGGIVRTGGTTSGACASPCGDATATAESPIVGDLSYTIVVGGTTVAAITIHIDLGTLTAHAKYTSGA
jgi:type II secretory pathway pseudopilin PulG